MYVETGARTLAAHCASMARIWRGDDMRFIDMRAPMLETINAEFPCGSGFDAGSSFVVDESKPERLVFRTSFHHMDECGMYDGWTEHDVVLTPCLEHGFAMRVTGRNRNDIKDYIADQFRDVLDSWWVMERDAGGDLDIRPAAYDYGFCKEAAA